MWFWISHELLFTLQQAEENKDTESSRFKKLWNSIVKKTRIRKKNIWNVQNPTTQSIIWTFFIAFTHCYLMWISRTYRGAMFKFLFGSLISTSSISKCNYQVVFVSCSCSTTFWTIKSFRIILFLRHKIYLSIYCN